VLKSVISDVEVRRGNGPHLLWKKGVIPGGRAERGVGFKGEESVAKKLIRLRVVH